MMRSLLARVITVLAEGCMYCGNTGSVSGRRCPICNGG